MWDISLPPILQLKVTANVGHSLSSILQLKVTANVGHTVSYSYIMLMVVR